MREANNNMSMIKSSKHAAGPFMAFAFRVCQFMRENSLVNRPYVSMWLGKTYVLPASIYAGQVWSLLKRTRSS